MICPDFFTFSNWLFIDSAFIYHQAIEFLKIAIRFYSRYRIQAASLDNHGFTKQNFKVTVKLTAFIRRDFWFFQILTSSSSAQTLTQASQSWETYPLRAHIPWLYAVNA